MSIPLTSAIFNHHKEIDYSGGNVTLEPQNMVGIFVGGAGDLVLTDFGFPSRGIAGSTSTYTLNAGDILPGVFTLVTQSGSTATQVKALYSGFDAELVRG